MSERNTEWCGECGHYVFTSPLRRNTHAHEAHTQKEKHVEYFINYGRWNDEIVGPFEDRSVAQAYADQHNMRTEPKVVCVIPPLADKLAIAEEACKRTFYVTMLHREGRPGVVKLVITAASYGDAERVAEWCLPTHFALTTRPREV